MNLKDFLTRKENNQYFWALVLEPNWVQAGIWQIAEKKAEVIGISPSAAWETDEELVTACDTALSAATQNLPEEITEPTKTVFGVPSSWVEGGEIKKEYLERIRKVCTDLSLEPSGFVVLPEALAHLLKSKEGAALNAITLGVSKENLEVSVFRLGSLVGSSVIARSVSLSDDVVEGLARFSSSEPLPSRILIYDGKEGELEEEKQTLMNTSWEENEKIKFLHTPKIEMVSLDEKILAVSLAGASEMGEVTSIEVPKEELPDFEKEAANLEEPKEEILPEKMGFSLGKDVSEKEPSISESFVPAPPGPQGLQREEIKNIPHPILLKVKGIISSLKEKITSPKTTFTPRSLENSKNTFIVGGIAFGLLLVLGFVCWWFVPKAQVTVYVSPKKLEETFSLNVDTTLSSSNLSEKVLTGQIIETEVSGEKTKATTGTKVVGEKAKGSVKLENGLGTATNFPAGTVLASGSDLKFTTDTAASVSAALSPGSPGTATVNVTASDIGSEYNLGKDEVFKVANYPKAEVDAIATSDFSGGSSRQISAVSTEDQKVLENDLKDELFSKAKEDLMGKVTEDKYFLEDVLTSEETSKNFSGKVGDEASNLKLSLDLSVKGVVVSKEEIVSLAKEVLRDKTSPGFVLRNEQLSFKFELKGEKGGIYELDVTATANLLPEIKSTDIAEKIKGKYPTYAEDYLTSIPGFVRATIVLKPNLPGRLGSLPHLSKNISIEVLGEK